MTTITRTIRLAVILEAVSCVALLYRDESLSFGNSWVVHLGWSTRLISNVFVFLFGIIHFPVLFLLQHVRGVVGLKIYNSRLTSTSIWPIITMLVHCALWSLVFFGLRYYK